MDLAADYRWYVARVHDMSVLGVVRGLKSIGFHTAYLTHNVWRGQGKRRKRVEASLFPGYLFVRFHDNFEWQAAETVPAFVKFLVNERGYPIPLPDGVFERVQRSAYDLCDHPPPSPFVAGVRIRIQDGPMSNFEGVVQSSDEETVTLIAEIFGQCCPPMVLKKSQVSLID